MKAFYILIVILLAVSADVAAQFTRFPQSGVIQFEKKLNMHALFKKETTKENEVYMNQLLDAYKKNQPQFKVSKSTLYFNKDKSLYVPEESSESGFNAMSWHPATQQFNTVFNDFSTNISTVQKKVFDETFVIRDTTRKISWKITDETREIAGYSCRRANALVMDSVYVVAFYTDQIPVSGGPEIFSGLPGMILGVALPHENVTYFATSVTDKPLEKAIAAPVKGKVSDYNSFKSTLQSSLKRWGQEAQRVIKLYLL